MKRTRERKEFCLGSRSEFRWQRSLDDRPIFIPRQMGVAVQDLCF